MNANSRIGASMADDDFFIRSKSNTARDGKFRSVIYSLSLLCTALCALASLPVLAAVPGQINYQGLLLDDLGVPVTGPVDMVFRLFDTETGGSALWTESHTAVDALDGVYEVALGSVSPISPSLLAAGTVYLEIEVETETMTPRQRLLAVPYALQAEDANTLGGLSSEVLTEIYANFSFDGADPPNDDPSEGLSDTDGDGIANFLDSDNDDDGLSDRSEVSAGSNINLVTPRLTSNFPTSARSCSVTEVSVFGANIDPTVSVDIGSQSPTPQNVISTHFDISVGPQAAGVVSATVTNSNGEQWTRNSFFNFLAKNPTVTAVDPDQGFSGLITGVHITGSNFETGLTVAFGSQNPVPTNVTSTGFDVSVGPQDPGVVTVTVTNVCGEMSTGQFEFIDSGGSGPKRVFVSSPIYEGDFGGLAGADATCNLLASNAGLTGTFKAWLSDGVDSPDTRFTKIGNPYVLVDDTTVVATDWFDLTDGTIQAPIGLTELSGANPGPVFTNVNPDGTTFSTASNADCTDWTATTGVYFGGSSIKTDEGWTELAQFGCGLGRLYCFEQ